MSPAVDIIICVHNSLKDVTRCLTSITQHTSCPQRLILVNDGSDKDTTEFLSSYYKGKSGVLLLENKKAKGYTRAANQGMKISDADIVILLNSDTVVTPGWLEGLLECFESDARIGIVGPLSNAASYQSVPDIRDKNNDWAENRLPKGVTPVHMAAALLDLSEKKFPVFPFVNGFCFAIKREVIEQIGLFDEIHFPRGYGEENDYAIRAGKAGFSLAVADHVYIFHEKSKSFSHKTRKSLSAKGRHALEMKHGKKPLEREIQQLERISAQSLSPLRKKIKALFEPRPHELETDVKSDFLVLGTDFKSVPQNSDFSPYKTKQPPAILFLLNGPGGGGGALSIVQEACAIRDQGWICNVAAQELYKSRLFDTYRHLPSGVFLFHRGFEALKTIARTFDIVVATHFITMDTLADLCMDLPHIIPAYYIQDYEPWIVHPKNPNRDRDIQKAFDSYTRIPDTVCFAKTRWIINTVRKHHDITVYKVAPGFDTAVFTPDPAAVTGKSDAPVAVAAMIRPKTPRRAPRNTMEILEKIKKTHGQRVEIRLFGCEADEPGFREWYGRFDFNHLGRLTAPQVADLMADADIFVDFSTYQAFGRTGLEAMAKGCATVLPVKGGVHEYARHEKNSLLVDTADLDACRESLERLIQDPSLRTTLGKNGVTTASRYSVRTAASSQMQIFSMAMAARQKKP